MKVIDLIQRLSDLDPGLEVLIAIDEEGNGFHKLEDIDTNSAYDPADGHYIESIKPQGPSEDVDPEDVAPEGWEPCIVLWP
jgi:hypothetical protein